MAAKDIGDARDQLAVRPTVDIADASTTPITFTSCRIGRCERSPLEERSLCAVHEPLICNALTMNGYPCHQLIDQRAPEIRLCARHGSKFTGLYHRTPRRPRPAGLERRDLRARWS